VTAECAVDALIEHFGIFGCPAQLVSDNGSQYVNNLIKEFTKLIGTEHVNTMAYSKEENAMIERSNKETMRHLKNLIFEYKDTTKWNRYSKMVQRIFNSTIHESIGVSPAQLLFGNAIDLDRGLFTPVESMFASDVPTAIAQWSMEMLKMQSELTLQAKDIQEKRDAKNNCQKNSR
jgi:transposase InsO family protein